jgi:putative MATE family efflux protein
MLKFSEKALIKRLLLLTAPIALQNIITYAVGMADNIMVGRLGELALSGVYVANQLQNILHMLVIGLSAALIILGSQFRGRQELDKIRSIVGIALKFALGTGIALLLVTLFKPDAVLGLFTDDPQVKAEAMQYLVVIRYTYIFFCITQVLVAAMRSVETVQIGMYLSIMTFTVNVSLNWVLIFGNLGAPALGIRGAAIATLVARIMEALLMIIYVRFIDDKLKLRLKAIMRIDRELLRRFFRYGLPVILGDIFWGVNLAVQGAIVGRLGSTALASVSIANVVFSIMSVGVYGVAGATAIIIGQLVGSGDHSKLRSYVRTLQVLFVIGGLITSVVIYSTRFAIPLIYDLEPQTLAMVRSFLTVLAVMIIGTSYQMSSLTGIVRAGGATHFVLINDLIHIWGFVIPAASLAAFVFDAPPVVVFALLKSDQFLKCIVAAFVVNRYRWVKNLTIDPVKKSKKAPA